MGSWEQDISQSVRRLWICGIVVCGALIVITALLTVALIDVNATSARQRTDEHTTCLVQERGLPASHELEGVIVGLHQILTYPRPPGAKPIPPRAAAILADLNHHLANYQRLEHGVPPTREC